MPYKEEETETVLPFRGGFRRGSWNARRALELPSNGEVKYRGPRKILIFGESGGLGRPLIKWSGNQPCDPSAEREVCW